MNKYLYTPDNSDWKICLRLTTRLIKGKLKLSAKKSEEANNQVYDMECGVKHVPGTLRKEDIEGLEAFEMWILDMA